MTPPIPPANEAELTRAIRNAYAAYADAEIEAGRKRMYPRTCFEEGFLAGMSAARTTHPPAQQAPGLAEARERLAKFAGWCKRPRSDDDEALSDYMNGEDGDVCDDLALILAELDRLTRSPIPTARNDGVPHPASDDLGAWLSAALDDPDTCDDMKADIRAWFEAGEPRWSAPPTPPDELREAARALKHAFRHADQSDWRFLMSILRAAVRHAEDQQTLFWIATLEEVRRAMAGKEEEKL